MFTCFLFAQNFDEEQCLCLRLNSIGQIDAPLAVRTISDFRALQVEARTIIVLPTASSSLCVVALPWLSERKARAAIPYALEEQLAQPVASLHFAFDKRHYQNGEYLVTVTDKRYLTEIMERLDALYIDFEVITLEWFALQRHEVVITEQGMLIHNPSFKGALYGELASMHRNELEEHSVVHAFSDSASDFKGQPDVLHDEPLASWIAQRLFQGNVMNVCQDIFQRDHRANNKRFWYHAAAIMAGVFLVSSVLLNALYWYVLTKKIAGVDQKIAVVYHDFFPEAQQVISPRFRIAQLLKSESGADPSSAIWVLLQKLGQVYPKDTMSIEQFRFQNQRLTVTLLSENFAALETLQQRLRQQHLVVNQIEASTRDQRVLATLELHL